MGSTASRENIGCRATPTKDDAILLKDVSTDDDDFASSDDDYSNTDTDTDSEEFNSAMSTDHDRLPHSPVDASLHQTGGSDNARGVTPMALVPYGMGDSDGEGSEIDCDNGSSSDSDRGGDAPLVVWRKRAIAPTRRWRGSSASDLARHRHALAPSLAAIAAITYYVYDVVVSETRGIEPPARHQTPTCSARLMRPRRSARLTRSICTTADKSADGGKYVALDSTHKRKRHCVEDADAQLGHVAERSPGRWCSATGIIERAYRIEPHACRWVCITARHHADAHDDSHWSASVDFVADHGHSFHIVERARYGHDLLQDWRTLLVLAMRGGSSSARGANDGDDLGDDKETKAERGNAGCSRACDKVTRSVGVHHCKLAAAAQLDLSHSHVQAHTGAVPLGAGTASGTADSACTRSWEMPRAHLLYR